MLLFAIKGHRKYEYKKSNPQNLPFFSQIERLHFQGEQG